MIKYSPYVFFIVVGGLFILSVIEGYKGNSFSWVISASIAIFCLLSYGFGFLIKLVSTFLRVYFA